MKRHFKVLRALTVIALILIVPAGLTAGNSTTRPMTQDLFNQVVDEQTGIGCPYPPLIANAGLVGDGSTNNLDKAIGPSTAWGFGPWPAMPILEEPLLSNPLKSSQYVDGLDCSNLGGGCLSVQLSKNLSVLSNNNSINSLDSSTGKPRFFTLNFVSCDSGGSCLSGNPNYFGSTTVKTTGEFGISLSVAWTSMAVCSTTACPEAKTAVARFWFNDPLGDPNLQYELVWNHVRVLRVSSTQWYTLADSCDGSRIATLYRQANNKKSPSQSNQGQYLIPFFSGAITGTP
jgi:hypothetical protein